MKITINCHSAFPLRFQTLFHEIVSSIIEKILEFLQTESSFQFSSLRLEIVSNRHLFQGIVGLRSIRIEEIL